MRTIRIVLDEELLKTIDTAAMHRKMDRSELIRIVLAEHLESARVAELEKRDRRGYLAYPQRADEYAPLEKTIEWPQD